MIDLSLKELRVMYPDIKATSKKAFIEQIPVEGVTVVKAPRDREKLDPLDVEVFQEELFKVAGDKTTYLVKTKDQLETKDVYTILLYGLKADFKHAKQDTLIMGREGSSEIHLGGATFIKITCSKYYLHHLQKQKWSNLIEII